MSRRLSLCKPVNKFIQSVDDDHSLLDSNVTGDETTNRKTKHGMALTKLSRTKNFDLKRQKTK
jgi:hypothetical protein